MAVITEAAESHRRGVVEIYNHYVATSQATFDITPFTVEERREWFEAFDGARKVLLVAVEDERVVGYAASSRLRPKPAYDVSAETTVYVHPHHLGRGWGRRLYTELLHRLEGTGLHRVYAAISLPNEASERLHRDLGYERVGVFSEVGFKFGRYWDIAWYERPMGQSTIVPSG